MGATSVGLFQCSNVRADGLIDYFRDTNASFACAFLQIAHQSIVQVESVFVFASVLFSQVFRSLELHTSKHTVFNSIKIYECLWYKVYGKNADKLGNLTLVAVRKLKGCPQ
jgi:hypothetical protein